MYFQQTRSQSTWAKTLKTKIAPRAGLDQFVLATTPLVLALGAGSIGLVIYTFARGAKGEDKD